MNLFPRIGLARSSTLVQERSSLDIEVLVNASSTSDRSAIFAATGGTRVGEDVIANIQIGIRELASIHGYPDVSARTQSGDGKFDCEVAQFLYESMEISASEAGRTEVWSFIGCVVVPDVVRWRFPGGGSGSTAERFAGNGGVVRNTFARLWWRASILRDIEHASPYHLLSELGEDEMVQIMERSALAGFPPLAVSIGSTFLKLVSDHKTSVTRQDLMRELMKRTRRLRSIISFESLSDSDVDDVISVTANDAIFALSDGAAGQQEIAPDLVMASVELERSTTEIIDQNEMSDDQSRDDEIVWNKRNIGIYLMTLGFEVRDRLDLGGNLWILGNSEISERITDLRSKGLEFYYRPEGGRGTGYEPAWLLEVRGLPD